MRYSLIIAGGSGTRLWPMSRAKLPKQLIPFLDPPPGKSLLQLSVDRLQGLVPVDNQYICAGQTHLNLVLQSVHPTSADRFLGEPVGRDTLNAVGLGAAVIARRDPDAVIAIFTADHVIKPIDLFQRIVDRAYLTAEQYPQSLVTFGISPTHPATAYGYLQLGNLLSGSAAADPYAPRVVEQFKEKPDLATAQSYVKAGPDKYLWNSGMFVWRAQTLLDCIQQYAPDNHRGLLELAKVWDTPQRESALTAIYPRLPKISVDYAVMEPASRDTSSLIRVLAVPMPLQWLDVGSWPAFASVLEKDEHGNALSPSSPQTRALLLDSRNNLVASSDSRHLIAMIGCENLIVIHTPDATLVCRADQAEEIKKLHAQLGSKFGPEIL